MGTSVPRPRDSTKRDRSRDGAEARALEVRTLTALAEDRGRAEAAVILLRGLLALEPAEIPAAVAEALAAFREPHDETRIGRVMQAAGLVSAEVAR